MKRVAEVVVLTYDAESKLPHAVAIACPSNEGTTIIKVATLRYNAGGFTAEALHDATKLLESSK